MTETSKHQSKARTRQCGDCGGRGWCARTVGSNMAAANKCDACKGSGRLPLTTRRRASAGHLIDGINLVEK